jgi:thiol-disulfide isomerase/thioredoxin
MPYVTFDKYGSSEEGADDSDTAYVAFSKFNTGGKEDVKMTISDEKHYELIPIQSLQHKKNILNEWGTVVIMIYGKWCGPCKEFKPKFAEYARQHMNRIYFALEDVDLGFTPTVKAVPSLLIYRRGQLIKNITGGNLQELHTDLMNLTQPEGGQKERQ